MIRGDSAYSHKLVSWQDRVICCESTNEQPKQQVYSLFTARHVFEKPLKAEPEGGNESCRQMLLWHIFYSICQQSDTETLIRAQEQQGRAGLHCWCVQPWLKYKLVQMKHVIRLGLKPWGGCRAGWEYRQRGPRGALEKYLEFTSAAVRAHWCVFSWWAIQGMDGKTCMC